MHPPSDFESFRQSVADAVERGDATAVRSLIHPAARTVAVEHGSAFRQLVSGLPVEIWHDDPRIAEAMGGSFRAHGSPRGKSALGYFRAAEDAIAATPQAPAHCRISVLIGHAAALRTLGLLAQSRAKLGEADAIMSTGLVASVATRIGLGARWNLEHGMLDLHEGMLSAARSALEDAHGHASEHLTRAEHIECLGGIALLDALDGDFDRALRLVAEVRELAAGTELIRTGFAAPALAAQVMVMSERNDLAPAAEAEPELSMASRHSEWEPFADLMAAQLRGLEGHPIIALDLLSRAAQGYARWETRGIGADVVRLLQGSMLLRVDHSEEAWEVLQASRAHDHHPVCPARVIAQLRLQHGDLVGAEEAIADCEALGDAHCARTLPDIQLLRAAIEQERGNFVVSDVSADRAFVTLARTGSRMPLRSIPVSSLSAIASRAADRNHIPEVARMLRLIVDRTAGSHRPMQTLSARERLVLAQVQRGLTVAAIAAELYISPNTVKTHLRRLYSKLGVSTRVEAIRAARALGLDQEITRDSPDSHHGSSEDAVI